MTGALVAWQARVAAVLVDLNAGRLQAAGVTCAGLLAESPHDPSIRQLAATVALRDGRPADAEVHVAASLAGRPQHAPTWGLAGDIALAAGAYPLASERFQRAKALDPTRPEFAFGHVRAVIARLRLGKPADVDQRLHMSQLDLGALSADLSSRFADYAPGWAAIGLDLEAAGQDEAAAIAFARAAKAAPTVAAHLRVAQVSLRLGARADAIDALTSALQLDPGMAPAWFKLGVALQDDGRLQEAIQAYGRVLDLDASMAEAAANLGIVHQHLGDLDAAKRAYGRAIRLRSDSFGRIAQALTAEPKGELWLDLSALRDHLMACAC